MMKPKLKRILVLIVGWLFILVGIAGLFLPVIQGILCLVIGLIILSSEYVWAHRLLQKLKTKFPKIAHASEEAAEKAEKWFHRMTGSRNAAEHEAENVNRSDHQGPC
jgi:uncharacterized protein